MRSTKINLLIPIQTQVNKKNWLLSLNPTPPLIHQFEKDLNLVKKEKLSSNTGLAMLKHLNEIQI